MSNAADAVPGQVSRFSVPLLGFGVFAVATNEFVLAGMLPHLEDSLHVSTAAAGQVVTVYALACAILGPVFATATAAWSRRVVLLSAALVYLVGTIGAAVAPNYPLLLVAQAVAAAGTGLFVPVGASSGAALVPPERRGRAIATVLTGFTAATAFGAPIGTAFGSRFGWRGTMWFVAGLAVVGIIGLLTLVPRNIPTPPAESLKKRFVPLADPRVLTTLGTTALAFTSVYVLYTYIADIFDGATGGSGGKVATLMFVLGIISVIGSYLAGIVTDRIGGRGVMAICLIWVAVCLALVQVFSGSFPASIGFIAVFAVACFSMSAPQQHRLIGLNPPLASVLVSLHASILYVAIALAGAIGGAGLSIGGSGSLGYIAAVIAVLGLGLSELAHRLTVRKSAAVAAGSPEPAEEAAVTS
ncbi:MFS transporter [Streptomyces sp. AV19]|uniref:MFS transporter n=1 Tax=Streptomyces sp. AV19 TaxID=2793068 RepID=UPI0018FEF617|nr:MFS transporter [Streptomyces sp. AV19]MBH1937208.1 MFS transporter [Streptomyces sp. AV19]MDG4533481.1 MFS transporter [Streptomyces sp. AV19]